MSAKDKPRPSLSDREVVLRRLLELGIMTEIRPPLTPDTMREEHEPIRVEGRPISEEIIEGRR
jgi:hypothetical protein